MKNLFDLTGKVAMITGASSGLGVQFANVLSDNGADLILVARRKEKLDEVKSEIEKKGVKVWTYACDVTKEDQVKATVEDVIKECGKIDILFNNAGVGAGMNAENLEYADWKKTIDVNLDAVFLVSKEVGKHMIERKYGKIVNTASMYGVVANMYIPTSPYHASKAGVVHLTKALATEWGKYNITVNAIGPGFFESEMTQGLINEESFLNHVKLTTPLGRVGKKGELDGIALYLASDASSYTTGQTICVDGGTTIV